MTNVADIFDYIDGLAPFYTMCEWDNSGLLVGDEKAMVRNVLIALDITPAAVTKAKEENCQLIVSHHPVIFQPIKRLSANSVVYQMASANISAICAHTNLDMAASGVCDVLAQRIGLQQIEKLEGMGSYGVLPQPMSPKMFAQSVKQALAADAVSFTNGKTMVKTVAVCSGAGAEVIYTALEKGFDAAVTGEIKHHQWLDANAAGITVVDAGHYFTERIICSVLQEKLQAQFPDLHITVFDEQPFATV